MTKPKKYRVRICIEELTFHEDGIVDDAYETGFSMEAGPMCPTQTGAAIIQRDLVERANLYALINEVSKGE